jgi:hypothetical protein
MRAAWLPAVSTARWHAECARAQRSAAQHQPTITRHTNHARPRQRPPGNSWDLSGAVLDRSLMHADGVYKFPNQRVVGHMCRTNIASNTAFRGFGGPQASVRGAGAGGGALGGRCCVCAAVRWRVVAAEQPVWRPHTFTAAPLEDSTSATHTMLLAHNATTTTQQHHNNARDDTAMTTTTTRYKTHRA